MRQQVNNTNRFLLLPVSSTVVLTAVFVAGCVMPKSMDVLSNSRTTESGVGGATISERADAATRTAVVSNPLAKEIRFDGQEMVLGSGTCRALTGEELGKTLRELLSRNKLRSANSLVNLHVRSAERMLIDGVGKPTDPALDFVAGALDYGRQNQNWSRHQAACKSRPEAAQRFAWAKQQVLSQANAPEAIEQAVAQLEQAAIELESMPLQLEAQTLAALARAARGETEGAVNVLASAAELASRSSLPSISSDLWMMACQASMRLENVSQARKCWQAAVANQLTAIRSRPAGHPLPAVDTVFWEQADKLKHPQDHFPAELNLAFAPWYSRIGVTPNIESKSEVVLWSAIAEFQLAVGQPHLAALSIKRAEVGATELSKPWLQVALARSMAAQGQESVAVTILGGLSDAPEASVRAASLATLGSIKVQAGAYEQGSRFLIKALSMPEAGNWPGKLAAKADLAIVRLIVGRLDEALPALHAVQNEMMTAGMWQSLCQSLENEAAIIELEQGKREARIIRDRIREIES